MDGDKVRGRPRMKMLDDLMKDIDKEGWVIERRKKWYKEMEDKGKRKKGKTAEEEMNKEVKENRYEVMKRMAEDRVGWRRWMPATCR